MFLAILNTIAFPSSTFFIVWNAIGKQQNKYAYTNICDFMRILHIQTLKLFWLLQQSN